MKNIVDVPVIVEDFEAGDRVYHYSPMTDGLLLGTVQSTSPGKVFVRMDDDSEISVPIDMFQEELNRNNHWGKCLPLDQVKVGSRLSIDYAGARRFTVVQGLSPEKMTLLLVDNPGYSDITEWDLTNVDTVSFMIRKWQLED